MEEKPCNRESVSFPYFVGGGAGEEEEEGGSVNLGKF